jgi:hypothetical protein
LEETSTQDNYFGASSSEVGDVQNIVWSKSNVKKYGSAVEHYPAKNIRYHLYPTWRSQVGNLFLFSLTSLITISASNWVSWTVIKGDLFHAFGTSFQLHLPILIFLPGLILMKILVRLYDSQYIIDGRGVEAQVGIVSFMLRQPRLRFEDIRGVEPNQTILERMFSIGHLEIGSAMKEDVEIVMEGIAEPRAVQLFLSEEIERSLRRITQSTLVGGNTGVSPATASMIMRGD